MEDILKESEGVSAGEQGDAEGIKRLMQTSISVGRKRMALVRAPVYLELEEWGVPLMSGNWTQRRAPLS
jgi:hypothetical protein